MTEKKGINKGDQKILEQLEHRVSLLISTDKALDHEYKNQDKTLNEQHLLLQEELKMLKEEIQKLQTNMHNLKKAVFFIGHQLKDKVPASTLESMQEKINNWPLESYITKKELFQLFEKYNNKKTQ